MNKKSILIVLIVVIVLLMFFSISQCTKKRVEDTRIIGTWVRQTDGATYVFKENGKVQVFMSENERDFQASNGILRISYGKRGDDCYCYEIISGTIDSEPVEILVLWEQDSVALKDYYYKK